MPGAGEIGAGIGGGGCAHRGRKKRRLGCVLCISVVIILNTLLYNYVPF